MNKQTTSAILMIEPVCFGFNEETATNNYFQQNDSEPSDKIQESALFEFRNMVKLLTDEGVDVLVVTDTKEPRTPDSIFPNNWISFHNNAHVVVYPMYALNRRSERRPEVLEAVISKGHDVVEIVDLSAAEAENKYLEGTGSMVLDRINKKAYAALSKRTNADVLNKFAKSMQYEAVPFSSFQNVVDKRLPIYHTNVMMSVGDNFAVVCLQSIDNADERENLRQNLLENGKDIIEISEEQMHQFAGNMLQIENAKGEKLIVMSATARKSLNDIQIEKLSRYGKIIAIPIPTIEKYGGGSVRCMMAEVFLPKK